MRIDKNGRQVASLDNWKRFAGPKTDDQWVPGRSAYELARAWVGTGVPTMPDDFRALLDSRPETRDLSVDLVNPEHRIKFDDRGGEPRNADLAFLGRVGTRTVAVTVEAKADEPFGSTIADTVADALERGLKNNRSGGVGRAQDLIRALLPVRFKGLPHLGKLRYQLLTAIAGTLAYAVEHEAALGVLVVHEFDTYKTQAERHARNAADYGAFLHRLGGGSAGQQEPTGLQGPFVVPGSPLFETVPPILIGKVTTTCVLGV